MVRRCCLALALAACGGNGNNSNGGPDAAALDGHGGIDTSSGVAPGTLLDLTPVTWTFSRTLSIARGLFQDADGVRHEQEAPVLAYGTVLGGQLDGNLAVATKTTSASATAPTYCRYDVTTGMLDMTFGTAGCAKAPREEFGTAGIAAVPGGYRAIVQENCIDGCPDAEKSFGLVAFSSAGVLDTTVGAQGILYSMIAPELAELAFAAQSTGDLVVTGYTGLYDMKLFRIHGDGSLDSSFGTAGFVANANGGRIQVLADDSIMLESIFNGTQRIDRFTKDGQPLASFGTAGSADLQPLTNSNFDSELDQLGAAVDPSGRIVIAYQRRDVAQGPYRYGILRLTANGALDTTFGAGGLVTTFGTSTLLGLSGVGFEPDGRIVFGADSSAGKLFGHLAD